MGRSVRTSILGIVAVVASLLALAAPASGSDVKAACTVAGDGKVHDKEFPQYGVRFAGGTGVFNTELLLSCVGMRKGTPAVVNTWASASGYFNSIVCGTGKIIGRVTDAGNPYDIILAGKKFSLDFVAQVGNFYWHYWDKPLLPNLKVIDNGNKPSDPKNWQYAGEIALSPLLTPFTQSKPLNIPPEPPGSCMKAFVVTGAIAIHEDGMPG